MMGFEDHLSYRVLTIVVLLIFYGIYFTKMLLQSKKGIRTHQIGTKKAGKYNAVELIMSAATLGIVIAQLLSVVLDWHMLIPAGARFSGFCVAMVGNALFLISVLTMRDSWRAGIPAEDKTEFVSNGIYRFSRNPAFLGFDLMYIGVMLMLFNPATISFTILAAVSLHLQILQEEKYLTVRFGDEYDAYRKQVFCYLGRKQNTTKKRNNE